MLLFFFFFFFAVNNIILGGGGGGGVEMEGKGVNVLVFLLSSSSIALAQ